MQTQTGIKHGHTTDTQRQTQVETDSHTHNTQSRYEWLHVVTPVLQVINTHIHTQKQVIDLYDVRVFRTYED